MADSKKQQTRDAVLKAAWDLFQAQGYTQTSTRQIARAAGVADGTVFSHFPSKLALLKGGMLHLVDQVLALAAGTDSSLDAKARLLHYATYLYDFYLSNREFSRELFKELLWQPQPFQAQLDSLKAHLTTDPGQGEVLADLYFMTLCHGLAADDLDAASLVARLRAKLAHIEVD
ncbi:TetR/AcrR family transcriptional regulator [Gallaecimonas xiamenensis]|uniref:TetR/AcrR family transcriptional regulator n=1 Tax=Gallaecimonas xiamenensis 3-C-1 TaxID=745411 RepID=K2JW62_9GAMM|nr:TetR/AcrR family transcriptional regulator [Gallaecimonas xiamenensis]EKE69470.1 TetR/AcrR family transcriptional regulator [Gallaecimonas xiamenensis 3-C-1]